jgi:hypothetical protein
MRPYLDKTLQKKELVECLSSNPSTAKNKKITICELEQWLTQQTCLASAKP